MVSMWAVLSHQYITTITTINTFTTITRSSCHNHGHHHCITIISIFILPSLPSSHHHQHHRVPTVTITIIPSLLALVSSSIITITIITLSLFAMACAAVFFAGCECFPSHAYTTALFITTKQSLLFNRFASLMMNTHQMMIHDADGDGHSNGTCW